MATDPIPRRIRRPRVAADVLRGSRALGSGPAGSCGGGPFADTARRLTEDELALDSEFLEDEYENDWGFGPGVPSLRPDDSSRRPIDLGPPPPHSLIEPDAEGTASFGEPAGTGEPHFDDDCGDAAKAGVEEWRVVAIGRRPRDYMQRDLLYAPLLRDWWLPKFRRLISRPPAWVRDLVRGLPGPHRKAAVQLVVLHHMHLRHLHQLRRNSTDLSPRREGVLDSLMACPPVGALVRRVDGRPRAGLRCDRPLLCPWCHARSARKVYERLAGGPCRPDRLAGRHVFLVVISVPSTALEARSYPAGDLTRRACEDARGSVLRRLLPIVRGLGCTGGLWSHRVTPWWSPGERHLQAPCYLHNFAVAGEIDLSTVSRMRAFGRAAGLGRVREVFAIEQRPYVWLSHWHLLGSGMGDPLRAALLGTGYGFDMGRLDHRPGSTVPEQSGLSGALRLHPAFLFWPHQYWSYESSFRGLRTFSPFGSWRGRRPPAPPRPRLIPMALRPNAGAVKQKRAFAAANRERRLEAERRREGLLPVAAEAFARLLGERRRRPGRAALRRAFAEQGTAISDRDARWLMERIGDGRPPR